MKVKELIKILSQCDPEGTVKFDLPMFMAMAKCTKDDIGFSTSFEPRIETLLSDPKKPRPDRIYISLPEEVIAEAEAEASQGT